jgi:hypothetical protein
MRIWIPVIGLVVAAMSCRRDPSSAAVPTPRESAPTSPSAAAVFDSMDTRVAVPLLPVMANHQKQNMREHLTAVQGIVGAIGTQDFGAISRAAATIGYSEQMGQMCNHMGAGAPGFTEQALRFHHTADKISAAARAHDMPAVLSALNETLTTCTGCHSVFKQRIVDETTWASLAGQKPPQHH